MLLALFCDIRSYINFYFFFNQLHTVVLSRTATRTGCGTSNWGYRATSPCRNPSFYVVVVDAYFDDAISISIGQLQRSVLDVVWLCAAGDTVTLTLQCSAADTVSCGNWEAPQRTTPRATSRIIASSMAVALTSLLTRQSDRDEIVFCRPFDELTEALSCGFSYLSAAYPSHQSFLLFCCSQKVCVWHVTITTVESNSTTDRNW